MDLPADEEAFVQSQSQVFQNNHEKYKDLHATRESIDQEFFIDGPSGSREEYTAFQLAAELGESEIIDILLGKSVHYQLQQKWDSELLLHLILKAYYTACSKINDNIKQIFAKNNIPTDISITINEKFLENFKPLHFAVKYQLIEIITVLIENGVDVEAKDSNGMTALHCAVQDTQMGLLKEDYILKEIRLSSIEDEDKINTYSQNLTKIIDLLLRYGCDINARDNFDRTPIFYLYDKLNHRADLKANSLSFYLSKPRSLIYRLPVNYSIADIRRDIIRLLFSFSPTLSIQDHEGNTILHLMAKAGYVFWKCETEVVEEYLRSGGNINAVNHAGYTPLHYACCNDYTELVDVLLQHGADINLTHSEKMERPIHGAVQYLRDPYCRVRCKYKFTVLEQLLKHGAYSDAAMKNGMTPILMATQMSSGTDNNLLIMCLLNWGCDLNCADHAGMTPLHYICKNKNFPMLDIFLKHGANINAVDRYGDTPFSIVRRTNRFSLDSLILFSYLKRLMILGVPLSDANKKLYALHNNMLELREFFGLRNKLREILTDEQCRAQLEFMKTVHVDNYTTLYDILNKNTDSLIHHVNNKKLLNTFCDTYFDEDYSVYGYLVKVKIKNAKKRAALLNPAKESLVSILKFDMPEACFYGILSHLQNNDLKNLIEAEVSKKCKGETEPKATTRDVKRFRLN